MSTPTKGSRVLFYSLRNDKGLFSYDEFIVGFVFRYEAQLEQEKFGGTIGFSVPKEKWKFIVPKDQVLTEELAVQKGLELSRHWIQMTGVAAEPRCMKKEDADKVLIDEIYGT